MDAERARAFLLTLPHVAETMQWGANLVFWVADKAIGGKMFCLINLDSDGRGALSFAAGPEHYAELIEREGFAPAPYFARAFWVAAADWNVLRLREWEDELRAAHAIVLAKLPPRTREVLALPAKQRAGLLHERRRLLAERAEASATQPKPRKRATKKAKRA
jgi:predicted DNA-binding protein (MmcQ/YjbR family)